MQTLPVTQSLRIERTMKAPAERIYKAWLDRYALMKFRPSHGATADFPAIDPKVGSSFRYSIRMLDGSQEQWFKATFLELSEFTKIRYAEEFETDFEGLKGMMEITVAFQERDGVTTVIFEHAGIPAMIPLEYARPPYEQSLDLLTLLVEYDA